MRAARLSNSKRLQRVRDYLSDGSARTTREIVEGANVCAVSSCISELRANGFDIKCRVFSIGGERRWFYRLVSE